MLENYLKGCLENSLTPSSALEFSYKLSIDNGNGKELLDTVSLYI
jgi:hypothetical protein